MQSKIKIAHVFFRDHFETRGNKFIKYSKMNGIHIVSCLCKSNSFLKFVVSTVFKLIKTKPDIIHAHRISGFIPAIIAKILSFGSFRILYDKHDYHKLDNIFDPIAKIFADYVIVCTPIHKQLLKKKRLHNVVVIENFSDFKEIPLSERTKVRKELFNASKKDIVILHNGSISKLSNPLIFLKALLKHPEYKNIKFVMVGFLIDKKIAKIIKSIEKKDKRIKFIGAFPYEKMNKIVGSVDLNIVLFNYSKITLFGNPNKIFESLACRIPVVITPIKSLTRITNKYGGGIIVKNIKDIERLLKKLNKNYLNSIANKIQKVKFDSEFKKYMKIVQRVK